MHLAALALSLTMLVATVSVSTEDRQLLALSLRSRDALVIRAVQSYLRLKYGTVIGVPSSSQPFGEGNQSLICQDYNGTIHCY